MILPGRRMFQMFALLIISAIAFVNSATVTIEKSGAGWQLIKDGQPYFIKGAGGWHSPELLAASGGNSIRMWQPDSELLEKARTLGLSVCLGILAYDFQMAKDTVMKYKDHPSILVWGIGNEMETGRDFFGQVALWRRVDSIAAMIKQVDGKHPCITVVGEISDTKILTIALYAPHLDALGINSYGVLRTLRERVVRSGWNKPFIVTEFGPAGYWEVPKTPWGLPLEQTSTEKESTYVANYQKSIVDNKQCLGGYAFLWADKQEKTHTWFGMFLPDGSPTGPVDGMQYVWTGSWPANRCPRITERIKSGLAGAFGDGSQRVFKPSSTVLCSVGAMDPESETLSYSWDIRRDVSNNPNIGGAWEPATPPIDGAVLSTSANTATVKLPDSSGNYRIFTYVKDPEGKSATTNCPIVIDADAPGAAPIPLQTGRLGSTCSFSPDFLHRTISIDLHRKTVFPVDLSIFSLNGVRLAKVRIGGNGITRRITWDASAMAAGVYFLKITGVDFNFQEIITLP
jgi:hypothetical protein